MKDENPVTKQNGSKNDVPETKTSKEKITIRRGPGYVPGLIESDEETQRRKPIYIDAKKRRLPPWAIAMIVLLALMLGLFLVLPQVIEKKRSEPAVVTPTDSEQTESDDPSNPHLGVVKVSSAPLFDSAEMRGKRIAELLLNEPVTILDANHRTMIKVRASDGTVGFLSRDDVSADVRSLSPAGAVLKLIVRTPYKRVMTHARGGTLLVEAPMGSILYADYRNGDLLRIKLPDGQAGWANTTGLFLLDPLDTIEVDHFYEQFSSALMAYYNRPLVPGGVTVRGISPEGAVFIAARLNGLDLPRTLNELAREGETVELTIDAEGHKELNDLMIGDLLFIHKISDPAVLESVAIRVDDGQILVAFPNRQTLQLIDVESKQARELALRITAVRRLNPPFSVDITE
ncbi:MAG TPA: C40 family peptidase [Clostridiaceae bacterium]|nr:C40 family peptidase [Clostridiaceae bacterium]